MTIVHEETGFVVTFVTPNHCFQVSLAMQQCLPCHLIVWSLQYQVGLRWVNMQYNNVACAISTLSASNIRM